MLVKTLLSITVVVSGFFLFAEFYKPALPENHGKLHTRLYLGENDNQPLLVGFGGGGGGNPWTRDYWEKTRKEFLDSGYAFLAIGYFGMMNTPASLDRISLDAIHDTITSIARHPKINGEKIALIGGSKGGELVLNLASRYADIDATIAIVPCHVSFPALTIMTNTSSWSYHNQEVNYVQAPYKIIIPALQGDLYRAHAMMLEDKENVEQAAIEVEKISGPILLMSAENDEQWPSTHMSEEIVKRLRMKDFNYHVQHISYPGGHESPLSHFDDVFAFLDKHFK